METKGNATNCGKSSTKSCQAKFPFLATRETFKESELKTNINDKGKLGDTKKATQKEKIPVGVETGKPKYNYNQFRPPCEPSTCCRRNPISATGPQDHSSKKRSVMTEVRIFKPTPPTSTYRDTIGKTGEEIFKAMKRYHLENKKKLIQKKSNT